TISGGVLQLAFASGTGSIANSSGVSITAAGARFDMNGLNATIQALSGVAGSSVKTDDTFGTTGGPLTVGNATSTTFDGVISGVGRLTKVGTGTLTLTAPNTYTGPTNVNGGTLLVNGSITSNTIVNNGGTLGGTGAVAGTVGVSSGGKLAPGTSPGILS